MLWPTVGNINSVFWWKNDGLGIRRWGPGPFELLCIIVCLDVGLYEIRKLKRIEVSL